MIPEMPSPVDPSTTDQQLQEQPVKGVPQRRGLIAEARRRIGVYRTFAAIPDNANVSLWTAVSPQLRYLPERISWLRNGSRRRRLVAFEENMHRLHDAFDRSPMAGRYWIWAGLLLGWAREGRVLPHDIGDADFGFDSCDDEIFDRAEPYLLEAGFRRWFSFRNSQGELTERVYTRSGFKFEFFRMRDVGADTHQVHVYYPGDDGPIELVSRIPKQELEPFEFLGRTWMKPLDHDLSLRSCYGNWRVPDPNWNAFADPSLVAQRPWIPPLSAR
jgi:hypothetical protein